MFFLEDAVQARAPRRSRYLGNSCRHAARALAMSVDTSYAALLRASAPAILNNVAAPLSSAARLALLAHASADDALTVIAAYTVVGVAAFVGGRCSSCSSSRWRARPRRWRAQVARARDDGARLARRRARRRRRRRGGGVLLRAPLLRSSRSSRAWRRWRRRTGGGGRAAAVDLLRAPRRASSSASSGWARVGDQRAARRRRRRRLLRALYPLAGDLAAAGWALALTAALAAAATAPPSPSAGRCGRRAARRVLR